MKIFQGILAILCVISFEPSRNPRGIIDHGILMGIALLSGFSIF